jgi:hypothetical protein
MAICRRKPEQLPEAPTNFSPRIRRIRVREMESILAGASIFPNLTAATVYAQGGTGIEIDA